MAFAPDPHDLGARAERISASFRDAGYTREYIDFWWNELVFKELGSRTPTRAWHERDYEAVESLAQVLHDREPATRAWLEEMKTGVTDGSILQRIAAQKPPREIVEGWRVEHSSE
jgi:hypothetical protein